MPSVLIQNGTVVNADSTVKADLLIDGAIIKEIRAGIPASAAETVVDATGLLLLPGGIDAHTHLDMPFGGTNSADDFLTGTRAAAIGGTTTIVDFAIQARGTKMRTALDTWWKKAEGKACIDYGLHMIVTDLPRRRPRRHGRPGARGRSQLQAVHGLSQRADGRRRDDLQGHAPDGEERRADLHACRERLGHRCHRAAGAGRGQDRAHLSRAHAAHARRGRSCASRHRHGGDGRRPRLHRASLQ